jgi:glycosyltransferase involved in cell wall biosynthesis
VEVMQAASISIVVPTRDRPDALNACLAALARQTLSRERFEVVVVDDGGAADLAEVVDRHRDSLRVSLDRRPHAGPAAARNAGVEAARGELLAFTDDDCLPDPHWLAAMAAAVERSPGSIVGGRTENALVSNWCSEASQSVIAYMYADGLRRTGELPFVTSNNLALGHELFDRLGGFDASFPEAAAEDRDLSARCTAMGGSLVYEPAALVRHAHPLDPQSLLRQYVGYGRGARLLSRSRREAHSSVGTRSPAFYAGMLAEPYRRHSPGGAVVVASLIALTQIATAIGYASGKRATTGHGSRPEAQPRSRPPAEEVASAPGRIDGDGTCPQQEGSKWPGKEERRSG